ncbi:MAG: hypothetical protein KDA53_18155 [Hyphomonas sp.]|nr:hypothetical protein [Hyphomonas sp.]
MSMTEDWSREPGRRETPRQRTPVHPRLGLADVLLQLWRAMGLMLLVFLPIFLAGMMLAFSMKKEFTARTRVLVSLGDEYVFRPSVGPESQQPLSPGMDSLIQSELEMLRSPVVAREALKRFDLNRVFPKLRAACGQEFGARLSGDQFEEACNQLAVRAFHKKFGAGAAPQIPVISATYTHEDPAVAAEVLNAVVGAYFTYRSTVFADGNSSGLAEQRGRFEGELKAADEALKAFLLDNGIGNFDAERDTVRQLYQFASSDLRAVEARIHLVDGQLAASRRQIRTIPAELDLYVDDTSQQTLMDLRLEREDKLSRYTEDSRVIREIDKRIAQAEAYLAERGGAQGTVRRGPNPLFQQVETSIKTLEAEAASLQSQHSELVRQVADFEARQQRLSELEPGYQELVRTRDVLDRNVTTLAEREIEARARSQLVEKSFNNIRILEPAVAPVKGTSLKLPVAVLALLVAGFSALMAGLARALTRTRFSTGRSLERTLGIPVVAAVRPL